MAKEIVFVRDKESHLPDNGSHLFGRMQYPYSERHKKYLAEIKDWRGCDKEKVWYSYLDDSSSKIKYRLKPLSNRMMNFVETIEGHPLLRKFDGIRHLSWEFAYYIYTSESEEAFRFSAPAWFIKIRDESGNIVHKNWTLAWISTQISVSNMVRQQMMTQSIEVGHTGFVTIPSGV